MKAVTIFLFLVSLFDRSENYRILGLFKLPGKSHMQMFESLMKGLAAKGHVVDVLNHFPQKKQLPRYNDISIRGTLPLLVNNITIPYAQNIQSPYDNMEVLFNDIGIQSCKAVFNSAVGKELLNSNKKYDLVITQLFDADCMLGFVAHFKVPVVGMITSVNLPWGGYRIGNPDNPSYIPNYYLASSQSQMNLMGRIANTVLLLTARFRYAIAAEQHTALTREFFGPDLPHLQDLAYTTSLLLVNSHFSINGVRPTVPNFAEVGGLHIKPPKALSKHLENSVNVSESVYKGVIYLSMGSMIRTETLPSYKLRSFFEAFKQLPYKVLWKAEKENFSKSLDIPSNIHFEPWMPQMDILCHPSVKLFVSHGGNFGTQESVYCGVPCLGIPIFCDQKLNIRTLEAMGLGIMIDYDNITKESILDAASMLLENPKYKNSAERISKLFKDRPLSPLDTAIYWVEHVIKQNGLHI